MPPAALKNGWARGGLLPVRPQSHCEKRQRVLRSRDAKLPRLRDARTSLGTRCGHGGAWPARHVPARQKGAAPGTPQNGRPLPAGAVQAAKLSDDARQKPAVPCPLSHLRAAGSAQSWKTAAAAVVILSFGRQVAFGLFCRCGSPLFEPARATGAQVFLRSKDGARAAAAAFLFFV